MVRIVFIFTFFFISAIQVNAMSIQEMIDDAAPESMIELPAGVYEEKIVIDKPIHLVGTEKTIIKVAGGNAAIEINANNVTLENLSVSYLSDEQHAAAVSIHGNNNKLKQLTMESTAYGIYLNDAHENSIEEVQIIGDAKQRVVERDHGIFIWKSHQNIIRDSVFEHLQDGIYIENSSENHLHNNMINSGRYGIHLMFTDSTLLENNESFQNISGFMIMGTDGTIVRDNYLHHNQRNIQSIGLLLFNVKNAVVSNNKIYSNRIGVFVENASHNEVLDNSIVENYVGMQFLNAEQNEIHQNAFVANTVQGQAEGSNANNTNFNYWDNHQGLDRTGEGWSDIAYEVEPFLLHLTDAYPPFQLLFNAPGMLFLEQMITTPDDEKFIDRKPLMENPQTLAEGESVQVGAVLIFSIVFLAISTITIYLGVKKL